MSAHTQMMFYTEPRPHPPAPLLIGHLLAFSSSGSKASWDPREGYPVWTLSFSLGWEPREMWSLTQLSNEVSPTFPHPTLLAKLGWGRARRRSQSSEAAAKVRGGDTAASERARAGKAQPLDKSEAPEGSFPRPTPASHVSARI